jgi:Fe-S oxidoreductase
MVFKKHYSNIGIKVDYFTKYLKPLVTKKSGALIIQHACPLIFIEFPDIEKILTKIFEKSGYTILNIPHSCCGGGVGHQLRVDVADKIALRRMQDFKVGGDYVSEIKESQNFISTYCPDAYWILKAFGRKLKLKFTLREMCDLLT